MSQGPTSRSPEIRDARGRGMAELILEVPTSNASKIPQLTGDDTVGRQSITQRDAAALGFDADVVYLRITGGDDAVAHARQVATSLELGRQLVGPDAERVAQAIDAEESAAAEGMGMLDF